MKANRAPRTVPLNADDRAVSPVLGTVLAIAIAIALAGAVFFMVRILTGKSQQATPAVAFSKEGATLKVVAAPAPPLDWFSDLRVSGSCAAHVQLAPNGGAAAAYPTAAGTKVESGDVLSNCAVGETLVVVHVATNRILYQGTF